jgi:hypothetical protein
MSRSIFDSKSIKPDYDSLIEILGEAAEYWKDLKQHLEEEYGPIIEEWKFYSQKSGWTLKVLRKKRNLFFLTPLKDHFLITFIFGDKAVSAIERSDLPESIVKTLVNAKKYMEGRGVQIDVKSPEDLENVKKMVAIKVNN